MGADGVFHVYKDEKEKAEGKALFEVPSMRSYFKDLDFILETISDGPTKSFAFRRLRYLESKFQLYSLLNEHLEIADSKVNPFKNTLNIKNNFEIMLLFDVDLGSPFLARSA